MNIETLLINHKPFKAGRISNRHRMFINYAEIQSSLPRTVMEKRTKRKSFKKSVANMDKKYPLSML